MTFKVVKSSSYSFEEASTAEINSLEELAELQRTYGSRLIISFTDMSIEVYDDWRE